MHQSLFKAPVKAQPVVNIQSVSNKYKLIYGSVGLMVVLFVTILATNIYVSLDSEDEALQLNLAGRQRMLSQRITKLVYRMGDLVETNKQGELENEKKELTLALELFNGTHNGLFTGGEAISIDSKTIVNIAKLTDIEELKILEAIDDLWQPVYPRLVELVSNTDLEEFKSVSEVLQGSNLAILKNANDLTLSLEDRINKKNQNLRTLQLIGVVLTIIILIWFVSFVIRKMKLSDHLIQSNTAEIEAKNEQLAVQNQSYIQSSESLSEAYLSLSKQAVELEALEKEADSIFSTVQVGLCLINSDGRIGSRVSNAMYEIFETQSLTGRVFEDFLNNMITEQDRKTLNRFVVMLFEGKTKESQLEKFSPLKQLEINIKQTGGGFITKVLNFSFKRIVQDNRVIAVLCTVRDMTAQLALENTLRRNEANKQRQVELLLQLVQSTPQVLRKFLRRTKDTLEEINDFLKGDSVDMEDRSKTIENHRKVVEFIGRKIHEIKGGSSMLRLTSLVESCGEIEDAMKKLKNQTSVTGDQFISSLIGMINLKRDLAEMEDLLVNLSDYQNNFSQGDSTSASNSDSSVADLERMAKDVAERNGKQVRLNTRGLSLSLLSTEQKANVEAVLVQLLRNSITHGIESPMERGSVNKDQFGTVNMFSRFIPAEQKGGQEQLEIVVNDDGRGLDINKIANKAISLGLMSSDQNYSSEPDRLIPFLFHSGFSTSENVTSDAGQGIGMDIIKDKVINALKGKLKVRYESGKFFEIIVTIPI
jgi:two-component system, chemotaxis family, sensor kinase CheA